MQRTVGRQLENSEWLSGESGDHDEKLVVTADSLGLEPKLESLWWASTCAQEGKADLNMTAMDKIFTFPCMERGVIVGHAFERSGKEYPVWK